MQCADIPIIDDLIAESNELFIVTLTTQAEVTLVSPSDAIVTIRDNDGMTWTHKLLPMLTTILLLGLTVRFTSPNYAVNEDGGSVEVCVERDIGSSVDIHVTVSSQELTASGIQLLFSHELYFVLFFAFSWYGLHISCI